MNLGPIAKAVSAAVVAGLTASITALSDGDITPVEWTVIVGAFLVALGGVFSIRNIPDTARAYSKAILAGLIAAVASVGQALTDGGVSSAELLGIGVALLVGLGLVATVPNAPASVVVPRRALDADGNGEPDLAD